MSSVKGHDTSSAQKPCFYKKYWSKIISTDRQMDKQIDRVILVYLQNCQGIKGIPVFTVLNFKVNMDLNWIIDQKENFTEFVMNLMHILYMCFPISSLVRKRNVKFFE